MFKRQKNKRQNSKSADKSALTQWTKQLRPLIGVTQDDFQSLYVSTIENFVDFVTMPDESLNQVFIKESVDKVIIALKKRQGYLLPLGADSEVIFREREEWTFAVFTASLMNQVDVRTRLALAKVLLPKEGYAWLYRNRCLFIAWQDYLRGQYDNNCFANLIPQEMNPVVEILPGGVEISVEKNTISKLSDESEQSKGSNVVESTSEDVPPKVRAENESRQLPEFTAHDLWQWLKRAISQEQITINQSDSKVHCVKEGLFVVIPQAIDAFLTTKAIERGIENYAIDMKERIMLTKGMKKYSALIRNEQGSRIHRFCLGQWQDRNVLSGFLLDAEALMGSEATQLAVNSKLSVDPMAST